MFEWNRIAHTYVRWAMSAHVYIARDHAKRALYVGQTTRLAARIMEHGRTSDWMADLHTLEVRTYVDAEHARMAEAVAQSSLKPAHGSRANTHSGCSGKWWKLALDRYDLDVPQAAAPVFYPGGAL